MRLNKICAKFNVKTPEIGDDNTENYFVVCIGGSDNCLNPALDGFRYTVGL